MLLLLRSPGSALPAGNAGIQFGVGGIAGPTAAASINFGVPAPTSLELNVFASAGIVFGDHGIPVGFLSGSATADLHLSVVGAGGFGFVANGDLHFSVTGTVGTTLQGIGNASTLFGGTAAANATATAGVSLFLNISGLAAVSGGTLTPTGSASIALSVNGRPVVGTSAIGNIHFSVVGTGFPNIVGLATDMRLAFESDEIRLFFRKG